MDFREGERHALRPKTWVLRLAGCLSSLDALIAARAGKLDALKTHKKELMQQLFPSLT